MSSTKLLGLREWLLLVLALLTIVGQVYLDLRVPDYMQTISTEIATPNSDVSEILRQGTWMLSAALGSMVCAVVTGYCTAVIGTTFARNLRARIFRKTLTLSTAEVNSIGANSLITRSTNDVVQVQTFLVIGMQMLIKSPIMAVWASSKIASQSWAWTVPTAIAVVTVLVILGLTLGIMFPRMMRMQKITDGLNRVTREHLTGLRVIRAYRSQRFHTHRFEEVNQDLRNNTLFVNTGFALMMPLLTAVMNGLSLAIYVIGAYLITATGDPEVRVTLFGQMIAFSTYALQVVSAFMMLAAVFIFDARALVSWRRIREVLRLVPQVQDGSQQVGTSDRPGTVEFRNVSFRYPDADGDALHGLSFSVAPGETLAIIGSTGAGKSSLVNLIPRFTDVREGAVLVNGLDVRDWVQADLRNHISFVPQKTTLFSGTIASNIALGEAAQPITAEDIVEAAHVANAAEFIATKEDNYASAVAQGGTNFSGGQKQRLAIARATSRQADIMIFDDSFSALDYKTDQAIRSALRQRSKQSTLIIVAQRIGTVRHADKIVVLEKGRIVGMGSHEELMANNPVYQEIALSQLSEEELA